MNKHRPTAMNRNVIGRFTTIVVRADQAPLVADRQVSMRWARSWISHQPSPGTSPPPRERTTTMTYYPDGGTKESPSYWRYKEQYFLPLFPAMETALGTDFGLGAIEGFGQTGLYPIYSMGPSGQFFNYADGGSGRGGVATGGGRSASSSRVVTRSSPDISVSTSG